MVSGMLHAAKRNELCNNWYELLIEFLCNFADISQSYPYQQFEGRWDFFAGVYAKQIFRQVELPPQRSELDVPQKKAYST